jgi:hypothetical protein
VELAPAVIREFKELEGATDVGDGLALGDQLIAGLELEDDLPRDVTDSFHA